MKRVSLKKIAEEAKVSVPLVSQVLNNKEVRASPETKRTIFEVANKYNYVPNRIASALKLKRTNAIAVLAPFTAVGFFSELNYYIEAYAMAKGYNTLVFNTFGEQEKEMRALQFCLSRMVDGFIMAPQDMNAHAEILERMNAEGFPFVFVDRYVDRVDSVTISSDHFAVAADVTRRLIDKGHRQIVLVRRVNEPENSTQKNRMNGYAAAMRERGLEPEILGFSFDSEESTDLVDRLSRRMAAASGRMPDAILLASGFYMPHLLRACCKAGYEVGEIDFMTVDSFVFPFEFIKEKELLGKLNGNLGVVVQDTRLIARRAVDALVDFIEGSSSSGRGFSYIPVSVRQL